MGLAARLNNQKRAAASAANLQFVNIVAAVVRNLLRQVEMQDENGNPIGQSAVIQADFDEETATHIMAIPYATIVELAKEPCTVKTEVIPGPDPTDPMQAMLLVSVAPKQESLIHVPQLAGLAPAPGGLIVP